MYTLPIKKWSNDLLDIKTKDSWRTRILQMGWGGDCTRSRGQGGKMFMPCRILFLRSRIQPRPLVLGSWSLNHWTTRQVPYHDFLYRCLSAASVCWGLNLGISVSFSSVSWYPLAQDLLDFSCSASAAWTNGLAGVRVICVLMLRFRQRRDVRTRVLGWKELGALEGPKEDQGAAGMEGEGRELIHSERWARPDLTGLFLPY